MIGFDIANSQPLLAAIAFITYSQNEYRTIKNDVKKYVAACENGKFYEYFMELNGINTNCEKERTAFKKEFFGKVFYTKEVEKENYLKTQFKEKYPTCYEAIFRIKGGEYYSKKYKDFPALMTEIETSIIYDTNIKLIELGYDVVNIFDSLLSDSEEAIEIAKQLVLEHFGQFGITPTLKDIKPSALIASEPLLNIEIMDQHNQSIPKNQTNVAATNDSQAIPHKLNLNEFQQREYKAGRAWMFKALGHAEYRQYEKEYDKQHKSASLNI
jgi:hypothetical protein